ncbi:MAG: hypothetical protein WBA74_13390, partial [Cyclobacteriaceae bacterium]
MGFLKIVNIALMTIVVTLVMVACNEPVDPLGEITVSLTEENRTFLFNTSAARNKARSNGVGGPVGFIFRLGGNVTLPTSNDRSEHSSVVSPFLTTRAILNGEIDLETFKDSTTANNGSIGVIPDCFVEKFTENEDGSYTYIINFGKGCDLYGEVFKGRLVERGKYDGNHFTATTTYEDFGNEFWKVNGTYAYHGVWEFQSSPGDSLRNNWSATYNYNYKLSEKYISNGELISVQSKGNGSELMDLLGYTVLRQKNEFTYASGQHFRSQVDKPLHLNFDCDENTFI